MKLSDIKAFPARVRALSSNRLYTVFGQHESSYVAWADGSREPVALMGLNEYELIVPKKKLHKYLMRSTDSHLPIRPILTFHFDTTEEFEYYKNQHSYELISYEGEVEVNNGSTL